MFDADGIEHINRFIASLLADVLALPKLANRYQVVGVVIHMSRQHVGKAAHFTTTHSVGLTSN